MLKNLDLRKLGGWNAIQCWPIPMQKLLPPYSYCNWVNHGCLDIIGGRSEQNSYTLLRTLHLIKWLSTDIFKVSYISLKIMNDQKLMYPGMGNFSHYGGYTWDPLACEGFHQDWVLLVIFMNIEIWFTQYHSLPKQCLWTMNIASLQYMR